MSDEINKDTNEKESSSPITFIIVGVIVVAVALFVVFGQKHTYRSVVPGTKAVEFTLPDLEGKPHTLAEYSGNVIFLNFWATWCETCKDEMPSMEYLYQSLQGMPFEIVAISLDEKVEDINEFLETYNLSFVMLQDKTGKYKELYKTTGVPETFIIDQNGVIAEKIWGSRDWSDTRNLTTIIDLLKNGPKENPEDYAKK